jgi:hypothetical protein
MKDVVNLFFDYIFPTHKLQDLDKRLHITCLRNTRTFCTPLCVAYVSLPNSFLNSDLKLKALRNYKLENLKMLT